MKTLAKAFRMARILRAYKRRDEAVKPLPLRLWIESASRCNLRCGMCPNKDMSPGDKGLMSLDLFRKLISEARGFVSDVYLHHRGEPLLNPALPEMIATARQAGLRTRFHSNGTLLDSGKSAGLVEAQPDLVSFSIDGFEKAPYEAVRVGGRFEQTVENIKRFAAMRYSAGRRRPYIVVERIRFRNPPTPENPAAIARLTREFLEAGVNEVIVKEEYTWAGETPSTPCAPRPGACCTFPWYAMAICHDGRVTPCPQDFWAQMVMGDANRQSLREIWNGEAYRKLRRSMRDDLQSLPLCRKCDRLCRKTVGGVPLQYMITFLVDQFVGYNQMRRWLGTAERNS